MLTREDQEIRRGRITSSTAAACLGLDPYCTPLRAWLRITGREEPTFTDDDADDAEQGEAPDVADQRDRGHWLEPSLIAYGAHWLVQDTRGTVTYERPPTVPHPDLDWLADSMDALYRIAPRDGGPAVLVGCEGKTVAQPHAHRWGEPPDGTVPDYVAIQCSIHAVTYPETRGILVPALVGGMHELRCYVVDRDRDLEFALIDSLGRWHHTYVRGDTPPPPQARDERIMQIAWKGRSKLSIPDDPIIGDLTLQDVRLRDEIDDVQKRRKTVRVALMDRLRDAEECRGAWGSVTWRRGKTKSRVDHAVAYGKLRRRISDILMEIGMEHLPVPSVSGDDPEMMTVDQIADDVLRECTEERPGSRTLRTYEKKPKGEE